MINSLMVVEKHKPPPHDVNDPYSILGLEKDCSTEDIEFAYRTLAKKFHPDMDSDHADFFNLIARARKVLKDPELLGMFKKYGVFNPDLDAVSILKKVREKIGNTLTACAGAEKIDVRTMDLIDVMCATIHGGFESINNKILEASNNTAMCKEVISRMECSVGEGFLVSILAPFEEAIKADDDFIASAREEMLIGDKAIELLQKEFKYHTGEI